MTPPTFTATAFSDSFDLTTTACNSDITFSSDTTAVKTTNADVSISCSASHRTVAVHRCILASRSAFFKSLFAAKARVANTERDDEDKVVKVELKELTGDFDVGFDSLVAVLSYLYSGEVRASPEGVCICVDDECSHVACRPAVDYLVEILYLSLTFQIDQLVALFQRRLLEILDEVESDDLLLVLYVADMCGATCEKLLGRCIDMMARSNVDVTTLEISLPQHTVKQIIDTRKELGLTGPNYVDGPDKHVKRIHRALELDDVELVTMLLEEGHTTADDAFALHFAVAHCDTKTTAELLDLGCGDVNIRNRRGYTVLHIAAMRKEPIFIVHLLTKGARPSDITLDGRNALQIAKRLTKAADFQKPFNKGKPSPKDSLCVEILEQAVKREPLLRKSLVSLSKAVAYESTEI